MSNNIRIRTTPDDGDKFVKLQLDQDFDFIEILSLKISQSEAYRRFSSDYGVIVGRVIVNNGLGVPNARVSVFIPISEEDLEDPEIAGLYPYEIITDVDSEGIRYNLLAKDQQDDCHTPVGTFPNKREVLDNEKLLEVHKKYYKYTSVTNSSGDFMIFGVPLGTYLVHMDVDMSDIGIFSQRPYDFISKGQNKDLFDSSTKFRGDKNLDGLAHIKSQRTGVTVLPFWGDKDVSEVGINRVDFNLNFRLEPSAIFMGSIFGDNEKNSINKQCNSRNDLGKLCDTTTNSGRIEMLRKTLDNQNERFDVKGGSVIDDDGVWCYQVPMNLDYMVTDEFGNLIPSEDPNKGIPTRTRVRFRVGMNPTGGEGRLRTRAKFLIPHNPNKFSEQDYSFDETTDLDGNLHFRDLYWNKIYSVKNYIPRFQNGLGVTDAQTANLRGFIGIKDVDNCVGTHNPFPYNRMDANFNPIYQILCSFIVLFADIVGSINVTISLINALIFVIRGLFNVNYISCITLQCDGNGYAPFCADYGLDGINVISSGIDARNDYINCQQQALAQSLNVYRFDFFNDWINGTLYSFLLKYKKKRNGSEKYCEYDCKSYDSNSDNNCNISRIVDTCVSNAIITVNKSNIIIDGVVKKYDDELYYAVYTHNTDYKLFATDIVSLGSIFDCDWQGIPSIRRSLVPTTYNIPPNNDEKDDNGNVLVSGIDGLLFNLNCLGITTTSTNCRNVKRICEIGVGQSEVRDDAISVCTSSPNSPADNVINDCDIDNLYVRNIFAYLNGINTPIDNLSAYFSGSDYTNFRDFKTNVSVPYPNGGSFYFYFGTKPNASAIDKMNERFFSPCINIPKPEFIVIGEVTDTTLTNVNDGTIILEILGGGSPFTFQWSNGATTQNISGLASGTYTVTVTDSNGFIVTKSFNVGEPTPLFCSTIPTDTTIPTSTDGSLLINYGGSVAEYTIVVTNSSNQTIYTNTAISSGGDLVSGLGVGSYTVTITDSNQPQSTCSVVVSISSPDLLNVGVSVTDISCNGESNGSIYIQPSSGTPPYIIDVTTNNGYSSGLIFQGSLVADTYIVKVTDSTGQENIQNVVITEPSPINVSAVITNETFGNSNGSIVLTVSGGVAPYTYSWSDGSTTKDISGLIGNTYFVTITDSNGCQIDKTYGVAG